MKEVLGTSSLGQDEIFMKTMIVITKDMSKTVSIKGNHLWFSLLYRVFTFLITFVQYQYCGQLQKQL